MKMSIFDRLADQIVSFPAAKRLYSEKVKKEMCLLYPAKEVEQVCHAYYRGKWSLLLKIWSIGILLIALALAAQKAAPVLLEGNVLERADGQEETVVLRVYGDEKEEAEISYEVQMQMFTEEEIEAQTERFLSEYEELICGENESLQEVHTNLLLQKKYDSYPMEFSWESSDYRLLGDDGVVENEDLAQAQIVQLSVTIKYDKTKYVHTFSVQVVPPKLSAQEIWQNEILSAIRTEDELQKYTSNLQLPAQIEGVRVQYEAKEDNTVVTFLIFLPVVSVVLYFAKDRDLEKELERRKKRMGMKYPEFVSKFQLLLGAGMTVRNIFVRMGEDAALGEELTEEIELLVRDMKNGMSVKDALDRFGKRTANPLYIKFSALLIQNMKKGTDDLMGQLSKEASEAFVLRKTNARQLGEEVGTKLLGPMILMLGVVMAVLIIPAFLSFQL